MHTSLTAELSLVSVRHVLMILSSERVLYVYFDVMSCRCQACSHQQILARRTVHCKIVKHVFLYAYYRLSYLNRLCIKLTAKKGFANMFFFNLLHLGVNRPLLKHNFKHKIVLYLIIDVLLINKVYLAA